MSCLAQWVHHSASHQHRWGYFSFSYGAGENNGHWSCGLKLCYFSYGVKLPVLSGVLYDCCLSYCTIWPQFNFESTQTVKHQNYCFVRLNNNKSCPMKRFVCVCVCVCVFPVQILYWLFISLQGKMECSSDMNCFTKRWRKSSHSLVFTSVDT